MAMWLAALPAGAEILVAGSSTILPIVKRVAESFTTQTGIRVRATGGGSDHGIKTAAGGGMQVGMVSRALRADEAPLLVAHTIGLDGVAVFVNESNGITGLSARQVTDIYAGRVNQWRDVAPAAIDGRIVRVGKWTDRSTRGLFDGFFGLQGREYPAGTHMIGANIASILFVSIDPQSVGYVSLGSLEHARQFGAPVKLLPIDGVAPSQENVASGVYPYRRPLNLVTRGKPQGEALRFIEWLKSPAGQQAVVAEGFLPIAEVRQ
jgi:phosphate transport system substrate-binding protein